jgi:hypothetical protein
LDICSLYHVLHVKTNNIWVSFKEEVCYNNKQGHNPIKREEILDDFEIFVPQYFFLSLKCQSDHWKYFFGFLTKQYNNFIGLKQERTLQGWNYMDYFSNFGFALKQWSQFCRKPFSSLYQFHQRFTNKFFVGTSFWQLFLVTFWLCQKICTKKTLIKLWWNWHLLFT